MQNHNFYKDKVFMKEDEYPLPFFENNRTAINLACDVNYLPYVMVLVQNIMKLLLVKILMILL